MSMDSAVLGIDFGTANSSVGLWRKERICVIPNSEGSLSTPSCVAFTDSGPLVGEPALRQAAANPSRTVFDVKRIIGRRYSDPVTQAYARQWPVRLQCDLRDRPQVLVSVSGEPALLSAEEVAALLFSSLKRAAECFLGQGLKRAVVACPSHFGTCQRQATKDALALAGLELIRIVSSPCAAALTFGLQCHALSERKVAFLHLGAGELEASLISIEDGVYEVLATAGRSGVSGRDWDNRLLGHCKADIANRLGVDVAQDYGAASRIRRKCEEAKWELTTARHTTLEIDCFHSSTPCLIPISRQLFEGLCPDLIQSITSTLDEVFHGHSVHSISEVVLIGAATRMPMVQQTVIDYFNGIVPYRDCSLLEVGGAVVEAAVLSGCGSLKLRDILTLEVTPHTTGMEVPRGSIAPIIPRNSTIPLTRSQRCTTTSSNQSFCSFKLYEGESLAIHENNFVGTTVLRGICPAPPGVPVVKVTFDVDANGILLVSGWEIGHEKTCGVSITYERPLLDREEIERLRETVAGLVKEQETAERTNALRNEIESVVYSLHPQCIEVLEWLETHSTLQELTIKLEELKKRKRVLWSQSPLAIGYNK